MVPQYIIGDLRGAGWSVKSIRENDLISDSDLYHIFRKVDIDNNEEITTSVCCKDGLEPLYSTLFCRS